METGDNDYQMPEIIALSLWGLRGKETRLLQEAGFLRFTARNAGLFIHGCRTKPIIEKCSSIVKADVIPNFRMAANVVQSVYDKPLTS